MVVGVARIDLRLFAVHSLKEKRSVSARLLHRLRTKYPLSVAEVGYGDLHQRILLGACLCAGSEKLVHSVFAGMEAEIEATGTVAILNLDFEYLHYGDEIR